MKTLKEFFVSPPRAKQKELQANTSDPGTYVNEGNDSKVCNGHGGPDPQESEHSESSTTKDLISPASSTRTLHNSKPELMPDCTLEHSEKSGIVCETASTDQQTVSQIVQRKSSLTLKKKKNKKEDDKQAKPTPTEHCEKKAPESASSSVNYADFLKSVGDDTNRETTKDSPEKETLENGMMEMSYEAFLNDSGTTNDENTSETDCKQKVEDPGRMNTKSLDNFPDTPDKQDQGEKEEDTKKEDAKPAKKTRGNIMNYFSKTTNPEDRMISSSTKMKISAMVHPSPSKYADTSHLNHSRKSSSEGEVVKSNVVADNCDVEFLSITHLDSQIINVPVRRKRKIRSAKIVSQEKTPDDHESRPKSTCENREISEKLKSTNLETQMSMSTTDGDLDVPQDRSKDCLVSVNEYRDNTLSIGSTDDEVQLLQDTPNDVFSIPSKDTKKTQQCILKFDKRGGLALGTAPKQTESKTPPSAEVIQEESCKQNAQAGSPDDEVQLLEDTPNDDVFSIPSKDTKKTQQCILKFDKRGGLALGTAPKQTESKTPPSAEVIQEESCKKNAQADDVQVTETKLGRCKTLKRNTLKQKQNTRAKTDSSEKQQEKVAEGKLRSAKPASENKETVTVIESSEDSNNELNDSFSVTMCGRKSKPLVLRFTRLRQLTQNTEEQQVKQVKLSRAQQLLQRARGSSKKKPPFKSATKPDKSKPKKPERSMDSSSDFTSPPTRRSSRNSSMVASLAIAMCYEGNTTGVTQMESTPKKQRKAKRAIEVLTETPVKSPAKTPASAKKAAKRSPRKPAKSAVKLASIFMQAGKRKANVPASPVKEIPQRPLTAAEIEVQRIRRQFLTSGLPEAVQRQAAVEAAVGVADYPPIPTISHVFQRPTQESSGLNVWELPDVALKLRSENEVDKLPERSANLKITPGLLTQSLAKLRSYQPKELKAEKPSISPEVEQLLLAEIHTVNPSFPVRRTYKQLTRHRNAAGQNDKSTSSCGNSNVTEDPAKPASTDSNKETCSKKRKHAEVQEDSDSRPARTKRLRRSGRKSCTMVDSDTAPQAGGDASQEESSREPKADDKSKLSLPFLPDGEPSCQDMLWTEKYQPQQATEILGNSGVVRKMKTWLIEWKHRLDAEMKRQRKLQLLQAKKEGKSLEEIRKKLGLDCWTDDGSDFALSDENEDDSDCGEDDNLCNTVLLTGPSGCGKTASVYALAKELGYKVFEVNASSKRNGRQVLAQLQEATQSHQVAKKKQDLPGPPVSSGCLLPTGDQAGVAKPEKKPLPAAFANFFTKKAPVAEPAKKAKSLTEKKGKLSEECETVKKPKGKGKRKHDSGEVIFLEEQQSPVKKKPTHGKKKSPAPLQVGGAGTNNANQEGLNLCSMSLILFEDVDVVFEEDRGLWAAIDTFMQSTKVPIILTTNDGHLLDRLRIGSRVDQFNMRQPHLTSLAAYLQLVCLAEKMRTRLPHLLSLVEFCRGDIRQSLLMLQFLGESGGSGLTREEPISYSARFLKSETADPGTDSKVVAKIEDSVLDSKLKSVLPTFGSSAADDAHSEDEFVVHKKRPRLLRKAIPIICDESSMDSLPRTPQKIQHVSSLQTIDSQTEDNCPSSQQSVDERAFVDSNSNDLVTVESSETMTFPGIEETLFEDVTCLATVLRKHGCNLSLCEVMKLVDRNSSSTLADALRYFRQSGFDLILGNLPFLLPLPITTQPPLPPSPLRSAKSRWSRIQCRFGLWEDSDDDDSGSGFLTLAKVSKKLEDSSCGSKVASVRKAATDGDRLVQKTLSDISKFYSDLSLIDTLHAGDDWLCERGQGLRVGQTWKQGSLTAGQDDHLGTVSMDANVIKSKVDVMTEVVSSAEALSLELCRSKLTSTLENVDALEEQDQAVTRESMSVYVGKTCERVHLFRESTSEQRLASQRSRAVANVCSQLPGCVQCQRRSVVLDYVPGIRAVCQLEECRKAYGNKRRFFHHLTSMMCGLKTSTVDTLVSSFK